MVHIVHDRPSMRAKAFDESGALLFAFDASGDAWGDGSSGPYGHDYPIPPGHYTLGTPLRWSQGDPSEGFGQIPMLDLGNAQLRELEAAGKAKLGSGSLIVIGGIELAVGMLGQYGRGAIMVHGGGSNLGVPACFADVQPLLKTEGCTRVHNLDWKTLAAKVDDWLAGNIIVWSAVGDPARVSD